MDDLDHSIHIAECDWSTFYDDSEECDLLQASLAYPDDYGLSDPEDSGNFNSGQQETKDFNKAEESCASGIQLLEQLSQSDATCMKQQGIKLGCQEIHAITTDTAYKEIAQKTLVETSETLLMDALSILNLGGRGVLSKDSSAQMTSDLESSEKPDPLSRKLSELRVSQPDATGGAEKERWFVTVNDNLTQRRGRSVSIKKKLKQKKLGERGNVANADVKQEHERSRSIQFNQHKEYAYLSEEFVISQLAAKMDREWEPDSSADGSYDSFSPSPTALECLQCSELQDGDELSSTSSCDMTPKPLVTPPCLKMPDENFTCVNDVCSETHPPTQEDQFNPQPASDLTLKHCPAADNPEAFAKAAGQVKPVYAISAFWDEVEKLTINDILQLRMGASHGLTEETVKINATEPPTNLIDALDNTVTDTSDTADSDYFTQPEDSKPDRSVVEFSTSDFEEKFGNARRNPWHNLQSTTQLSESVLLLEEDASSDSDGRETPVALDQSFDNHEIQNLISCPRRMTKSRSMYNVQVLDTENLPSPPSPSIDDSDLSLSRHLLLEAFLSHTDSKDYRMSCPEIYEYFFTEYYDNTQSQFLTVHDPEDIIVSPVFYSPLYTFRQDPSSYALQCSTVTPIPIFSCSRPTIRDLKLTNVILCTDCEELDNISPMRIMSHSFIQASPHGSSGAAGQGGSWKSFISLRKIQFPDKGSISCSNSGAWIFPIKGNEIQIGKQNQIVRLFSNGGAKELGELGDQQTYSETSWSTERRGIFSRVRQSDMCLVCIAFASWVLRSSNPEAAEGWKAALLANVSALSAIQYLRQYMRTKNPPIDDL